MMRNLRGLKIFPVHSFKRNLTYSLHQWRINPLSMSSRIHTSHIGCDRSSLGLQRSTYSDFLPPGLKNYMDDFWLYQDVHTRDSCDCSMCVDPYSGQKKFKTSDIPLNIRANYKFLENRLEVTWENDIPGFKSHVSIFPKKPPTALKDKSEIRRATHWRSLELSMELPDLRFDYQQFVQNLTSVAQACQKFLDWGIIFVTGVPKSEQAVETIANCIGCIYNSFYGKTWDVRSIPQAHNVAYTNQALGLHQDLLYMKDPPGIQLLHCIKNTASGGESLFCDGFQALSEIGKRHRMSFQEHKINYHYKTAKEEYQASHQVFIESPQDMFCDEFAPPILLNYSPPFQTSFPGSINLFEFEKLVLALKEFARISESPKNVFQYKLKEGECVIFNNRRILHGRKAFDTQKGERWLKGCYVSADSFRSRLRIFKKGNMKE